MIYLGGFSYLIQPLTPKRNERQRIRTFLNWFIRHYSTEITTDRGLLYYANAMGEEVSIAEILEHYNREK